MTTIVEQLEAHKGCMSLSELAEMLAVNYFTVYKWVRQYDLPATKIAGTYWIDPHLAARWWEQHSTVLVPGKRPVRREHVA